MFSGLSSLQTLEVNAQVCRLVAAELGTLARLIKLHLSQTGVGGACHLSLKVDWEALQGLELLEVWTASLLCDSRLIGLSKLTTLTLVNFWGCQPFDTPTSYYLAALMSKLAHHCPQVQATHSNPDLASVAIDW